MRIGCFFCWEVATIQFEVKGPGPEYETDLVIVGGEVLDVISHQERIRYGTCPAHKKAGEDRFPDGFASWPIKNRVGEWR